MQNLDTLNKIDVRLREKVRSGSVTGQLNVVVVTTDVPLGSQRELMESYGFKSDGEDINTLFGGTIDATNLKKLSSLSFVRSICESVNGVIDPNAKPRKTPKFSDLQESIC